MGCGASTTLGDDREESEVAKLKRVQACKASIKKNSGRLFVFGVLQRANVRNRNGRVYPKDILKRESERYYETHVKTHCALGELDHPNPTSDNFRSLTVDNISHRVLDYYWEGDDLIGYVEVLSTPAGSMLKDLYLTGCRLGMSSRGWATLKEKDGLVFIEEDFELITFDFVSDPSTEGAYLMPVKTKLDVPHTLPINNICEYLRAGSVKAQATANASAAPVLSHQDSLLGGEGHQNVLTQVPRAHNGQDTIEQAK